MINIIEMLDNQDVGPTADMRYGRHLFSTWDTFTAPVEKELAQCRNCIAPDAIEQLTQDFLTQCDEKGYDPNNDDVRFTYLMQIGKTCPDPFAFILLLRDMHLAQIVPVVFEDDRLFPTIFGVFGRYAAMGGLPAAMLRVNSLEELLNLLLK
jgi:hypothetical protein